MKKTYVQRNYKDTIFRMLFQEKENLLSLYNALNKTDYTDVDMLEITTLENAEEMPFVEAVERAVDECIKEGILAEFLAKNRAEAVRMNFLEFDEEEFKELMYKEGHEDGVREGREEGEQRNARQAAFRMLEDAELPLEKIAQYCGLPLETVRELQEGLLPVE